MKEAGTCMSIAISSVDFDRNLQSSSITISSVDIERNLLASSIAISSVDDIGSCLTFEFVRLAFVYHFMSKTVSFPPTTDRKKKCKFFHQ